MSPQVKRVLMTFGLVLVLEAIVTICTRVLLLSLMLPVIWSADCDSRLNFRWCSPQLVFRIKLLRLLWAAFANPEFWKLC